VLPLARGCAVAAVIALSLVAALGSAHAQVGESETVLNPNLATEAELAAVDGLTDGQVETILKGRPFFGMAALDAALEGGAMDEADRDALYALLFVPLNLNEAARDEILLVPGIGDRMAHEFEEYRPYRALAEFRREIGKYVDDDEVARLEQFVFVPVSLNQGSDEAILSIPGVGSRMLHEFKEYRPYRALAEFRREIGKYVDESEVARLERYVKLD